MLILPLNNRKDPINDITRTKFLITSIL